MRWVLLLVLIAASCVPRAHIRVEARRDELVLHNDEGQPISIVVTIPPRSTARVQIVPRSTL